MTEYIPTLTHATERDVDLIVVEEIVADVGFVRLLCARAFGSKHDFGSISGHFVQHSTRRMTNRREIDIRLKIETNGTAAIIILIENKLDASDQPRQSESYREEAEHLIANGEAADVATLLISPKAYSDGNPSFSRSFNATLSYEEILEYIRDRAALLGGELSRRLVHRAELIDQAISKGRRGYIAVPFAPVSAFNTAYVTVLLDRFPKLIPGPSMTRPDRPGESVTMIFGPASLPDWPALPQMRIVHQLREGNANINFYGWGDYFSDLAAMVGEDVRGTGFSLTPTTNKRKNGKTGLVMFVRTPVVDNARPFLEQHDDAVAGMSAAERLRAWIWQNQPKIEQWARAVADLRRLRSTHS